jgi:O-antigen/teichoic acid export membrane protein
VDQGALSLGGFLTNIILARTLSAAEYGLFSVIFGALLFLNGLHGAIIAYPLSVKGASGSHVALGRLAGLALLLSLVCALPACAGILGVAWMAGVLRLAPWIIGALLFWQLQETVRRALLAHMRHSEAVWGDALSYLGQAAAVWGLAKMGQLSLHSSFGVMALTSGMALALQSGQLGLGSALAGKVWQTVKEFWSLGRWMLLSNLVSIFTVQALSWTLALFHGPAEVARLQAIGNLLGVTHPVMFSVGNLIVPAVARARLARGVGNAGRSALPYAVQGGGFLAFYYAILALYPRGALALLYGPGSAYLGLEAELRLYLVVYALIYVAHVLSAFLCGLEQSRVAFLAQFAGSVAALFISLPLAARGGLMAALYGSALSSAAQIAACLWSFRRIAQAREYVGAWSH